MVVAYNCDERYASIFATSVLSLFECNKEVEELTVYLIDNGIKPESIEKIQKIASIYRRDIIVVQMPDLEKLVGMSIAVPEANTRIATCGRLFVASLLPENIDKVLYFDSDTIFMRSVEKLWNVDLGENYAGMMADALNPNFRTMLGIPAEGIYFNSGVVLINMKLWRETRIEEKFMNYLREQGGFVPWPDQGILNAVLDGRILCLPCEFNVITRLFSFSYDDLIATHGLKWYYTREEVDNAVKDPGVIHFITTFSIPLRPWCEGCNHPYTAAFLNYRKMTPWKDEPLWKDNRSPSRRKIYELYTHFSETAPKWLYVWVTGQFFTKLRPLAYRIKKRKFIRDNMKRAEKK